MCDVHVVVHVCVHGSMITPPVCFVAAVCASVSVSVVLSVRSYMRARVQLLWAEAVLRTSPLAVNLSICLTIPLAFVLDYVSHFTTLLVSIRALLRLNCQNSIKCLPAAGTTFLALSFWHTKVFVWGGLVLVYKYSKRTKPLCSAN